MGPKLHVIFLATVAMILPGEATAADFKKSSLFTKVVADYLPSRGLLGDVTGVRSKAECAARCSGSLEAHCDGFGFHKASRSCRLFAQEDPATAHHPGFSFYSLAAQGTNEEVPATTTTDTSTPGKAAAGQSGTSEEVPATTTTDTSTPGEAAGEHSGTSEEVPATTTDTSTPGEAAGEQSGTSEEVPATTTDTAIPGEAASEHSGFTSEVSNAAVPSTESAVTAIAVVSAALYCPIGYGEKYQSFEDLCAEGSYVASESSDNMQPCSVNCMADPLCYGFHTGPFCQILHVSAPTDEGPSEVPYLKTCSGIVFHRRKCA